MTAFAFVLLMLSVASAQDTDRYGNTLDLTPMTGIARPRRTGNSQRLQVPRCVCPSVIAPVCAGRTFTNRCLADCVGAVFQCTGPCPCHRPPPVPAGCVCATEFAPVCGSDGTTYSNRCEAGCKHATVECEGGCPCSKPSPPPPTPSDIKAFLDECVKKGEVASVSAARAACSEVILKCPLTAPELEAIGSAAAFSTSAEPSLSDALLEAVLQGTCLVEAEVACRSNAFDNISDSDCQLLLDFGPVNVLGESECSTLQDANDIFNAEVTRLCKRK